jgi:tetratricopeptide (TPR) repeat protein
MSELTEEVEAEEKKSALAGYLTMEPVLLAALVIAAVTAFAAVGGLSRLYHAQQESLGTRWYERGSTDLAAKRYDAATVEFRTALRYARDDYSYRLGLAESLIGLKRTDEAQSYLMNLWEREPENGLVNLELARIAVQKDDSDHALRYYHNAVNAAWPAEQRRDARVELIEYLLKINADEQAQAELIALEANLGDDVAEQVRVGDLFVRAKDYEHALEAYRRSLQKDRNNHAALAGAGFAAFQTGQYAEAAKYLQGAVRSDAGDAKSTTLLTTAEQAVQLDPFQREWKVAQRNQIVLHDFATAGERLKTCGMAAGAAGPVSSQPTVGDRWQAMKAQVTERGLARDPDLAESAMDVVFDAERQAAATCGTPQGADETLLLIEKAREGK